MKVDLRAVSAWVLAGILIFSAVDKILHYGGFLTALGAYVLVPEGLVTTLGPCVIVTELYLGLALLWVRFRNMAAFGSAGLLFTFAVVLYVNQRINPGAPCGCWFTVTLAQGTSAHVLQNMVMACLALSVGIGDRNPVPGSPSEKVAAQ
jgi:hypothetical protein